MWFFGMKKNSEMPYITKICFNNFWLLADLKGYILMKKDSFVWRDLADTKEQKEES